MNDATMVCETTWDESPTFVVFKGREDWPVFVPERTCELINRNGFTYCTNCTAHVEGQYADATLMYMARFCPCCGAKVVEQ